MHHLLVDPTYDHAVKWAGATLVGVLLGIPSAMHGIAVPASVEKTLRKRGVTGLWGWLRNWGWGNPIMILVGFSVLLFGVGGFDGTVATTMQLNMLVHNTMWIPAHIHGTWLIHRQHLLYNLGRTLMYANVGVLLGQAGHLIGMLPYFSGLLGIMIGVMAVVLAIAFTSRGPVSDAINRALAHLIWRLGIGWSWYRRLARSLVVGGWGAFLVLHGVHALVMG